MDRVFGNGPGDRGTIPGRIIPKTQKMLLDASLLNTQHYKVYIKDKVEQSREKGRFLTSYWKGSLRVDSTSIANFYMYKNGFGIKSPTVVDRP